MKPKVISLGRYLMMMSPEPFNEPPNTGVEFCGIVTDLDEAVALKVCPFPNNVLEYYQAALNMLWKGKGMTSESALMALKSYLPAGTVYVCIWNPLE